MTKNLCYNDQNYFWNDRNYNLSIFDFKIIGAKQGFHYGKSITNRVFDQEIERESLQEKVWNFIGTPFNDVYRKGKLYWFMVYGGKYSYERYVDVIGREYDSCMAIQHNIYGRVKDGMTGIYSKQSDQTHQCISSKSERIPIYNYYKIIIIFKRIMQLKFFVVFVEHSSKSTEESSNTQHFALVMLFLNK